MLVGLKNKNKKEGKNMKKKIIGSVALASIAALSLTACDNRDPNTIDAVIVYKSNSGMTYRQEDATTLVDGQSVKRGDLLPMWQELERKFGVKFNDASDYSQDSTKGTVTKFMQDGYVSGGQKVELLMTMNSQTTEMANAGKLVPLSDHLDEMPNFKAYLESHPSVEAQLKQANGKIYNTPYFDGVDNIEKYYMVNSDYLKKLLDDEYPVASMDSKAEIISKQVYTAFYEDMKGRTIAIADQNGNFKALKVSESMTYGNAVDAQKNATNGQEYVQALRDYIDAAYRYNDELEAIYPNRSDVFLSASACYNVDDMVALWRCVRTNPQYLAKVDSINVFFPRSGEANRQRGVVELLSAFGVRGMSAEKEKLYFDETGKLHDARIEGITYQGLQKLNQIYQEGLIVQNYSAGYGGQPKSEWRKALLEDGTGFASYDYTGTTSPYAVGPSESYTAILPPAAIWQVGEAGTDNSTAVTKGPDGKEIGAEFYHFTEDCRALKDGGWCIPNNYDYENLNTLLHIMDYMFCDEGADLQDYGPNTTDYRAKVIEYDENGNRITTAKSDPDAMISVNGNDCVIISDKVMKDITARNKNWNDYYRQFVGSTQGIGHIRSDGLDFQTIIPTLKEGMDNCTVAIQAGAMFICRTDSTGTYFSCVPSSFAINQSQQNQIDTNCQTFADAWKEDSGSNTAAYTKYVVTASEITDEAIRNILNKDDVDAVLQFYLPAYQQVYENSLKSQ